MSPSEEFLQRYGGIGFQHAEELLPLLRAGQFVRVVGYPGTQPCHEIAQVYRDRADMLDHYGNQGGSELWTAFTSIATTLSESPDEPCRLWIFRGEAVCFLVFEMADSQRIAGCLKTDGASERELESFRKAESEPSNEQP